MKKHKIKGKICDSDHEYNVYNQLLTLLPNGATVEYKSHKIRYVVEYDYVPDFTITFSDGRVMYISAQGNGRQFDNNTRDKMRLIKAQHPDKDIKIVFINDGRIGGVKQRKRGGWYKQSEWSERHKFPYSIKEVKQEWFK